MVENSATTSSANRAAARESRGSPHYRTRSRLSRLLKSVLQTADLQFRIFLLRAQISLRQIVVYTLLLIVAGLAAIAGFVFLSIAAFRLLAASLGTQWTLLLFAAIYISVAAILMGLANRVLHKCVARRPVAPGGSLGLEGPMCEATHDA